MTCIVALKHDNKVLVGADRSICILPDEIDVMSTPKVFKTGQYVIGAAGSYRTSQLLEFTMKPPRPPKRSDDLMKFMVNNFCESLRKCLKSNDAVRPTAITMKGSEYLIGIYDRIFLIDEEYGVVEAIGNYTAAGMGKAYALGSLYTSSGMQPDARVLKALEAAGTFSAWVKPPYDIIST